MQNVVGSGTEKMSVNANDECYAERNTDHDCGQSVQPLRERDQPSNWKQIDQDQQWGQECGGAWLNFDKQPEVP